MNIIELAKQAGFKRYQEQAPGIDGVVGNWEDLGAFAALVAAHEREECAKKCDEQVSELYASRDTVDCAEYLAGQIRARGTT